MAQANQVSIDQKQVEKSIKKGVKRVIAERGIGFSTKRGNKELNYLIGRLSQQPFNQLETATQIGRELGEKIVALSQSLGKTELDQGVIRQLILRNDLPLIPKSSESPHVFQAGQPSASSKPQPAVSGVAAGESLAETIAQSELAPSDAIADSSVAPASESIKLDTAEIKTKDVIDETGDKTINTGIDNEIEDVIEETEEFEEDAIDDLEDRIENRIEDIIEDDVEESKPPEDLQSNDSVDGSIDGSIDNFEDDSIESDDESIAINAASNRTGLDEPASDAPDASTSNTSASDHPVLDDTPSSTTHKDEPSEPTVLDIAEPIVVQPAVSEPDEAELNQPEPIATVAVVEAQNSSEPSTAKQ
jgi:hypothetical protein